MNNKKERNKTHRHRNQAYDYQRGKGSKRDKLEIWDYQIQNCYP